MLHTIGFFCFFRIVPTIHGADQITGDPANPLKGSRLEAIMQVDIVSVYSDINAGELFVRIFFSGAVDISFSFLGGNFSSAHMYGNQKMPPYALYFLLSLLYHKKNSIHVANATL